MSLALDRPEFAPPPQRGTLRALILALIAHVLLIAALTWGVRWKSESDDDAVEAELWSATPQVAAPRIATPTPAPAPTPAPPPPPPPPAPAPKPPEPVATPKTPDIALEREKKLREAKEQKERELEQQRQQEKKRQEMAAAQEKKDKELEAKKREEAERQKEQQKEQQKLAEQKKREEAAKKAEAQKAQLEKDRQDNLRRLMGQAGSTAEQTTGPRSGKGAGSGGPSSGYYGRVSALIKRNIIFPSPELISGNSPVDIEITTSPDGTIVGSRIVKSSGVPAWDEAALRAIQRTEVMPRDIDGRVPNPFPPIRMRPKDFQ